MLLLYVKLLITAALQMDCYFAFFNIPTIRLMNAIELFIRIGQVSVKVHIFKARFFTLSLMSPASRAARISLPVTSREIRTHWPLEFCKKYSIALQHASYVEFRIQ